MRSAVSEMEHAQADTELTHAQCSLNTCTCALCSWSWRMRSAIFGLAHGQWGFQQMAHAQCNLSAEACALQNQGWRMGSVDKKIAHAH